MYAIEYIYINPDRNSIYGISDGIRMLNEEMNKYGVYWLLL